MLSIFNLSHNFVLGKVHLCRLHTQAKQGDNRQCQKNKMKVPERKISLFQTGFNFILEQGKDKIYLHLLMVRGEKEMNDRYSAEMSKNNFSYVSENIFFFQTENTQF